MDPAAPVKRSSDAAWGVRDFVAKRRRSGTDLKRVAEIVLVLSSMASIRGCRKPTEAEVVMMAEARAKLVEMCESVAPKEIVDGTAVGRVIEDLGLISDAKYQTLGFSGPKLSIAEKMALSKKKMEESKKFVAHPGTQAHLGTAVKNCGTPLIGRKVPSDKPGQTLHSSGTLPASSLVGHISAATYKSPAYQVTISKEKTPSGSSGIPSSCTGKVLSLSALPEGERTQIKVEGGTNGHSYPSPIQVSSVNGIPVKAPTWSAQPESALLIKAGTENKITTPNSTKFEGTNNISTFNMASQGARDQTFRPFFTQTVSGSIPSIHQPFPGMNFVKAPTLYNPHNEAAKIVQKELNPISSANLSWTAPSRDYMSKAMTCQICKHTISEVNTVLICDACEKGYHLKCLQSANQQGIPIGEWHCPKCLALNIGKPLPPKYGRVTRNPDALKMDQHKITANGNHGLQISANSCSINRNHVESKPDSEVPNARESQPDVSQSNRKHDQAIPSEFRSNLSVNFARDFCGHPVGFSAVRSLQEDQNPRLIALKETSIMKSKPECAGNAVLPASASGQDVSQSEMRKCSDLSSCGSQSNARTKGLEDHCPTGNINCTERDNVGGDIRGTEQVNAVAVSMSGTVDKECSALPSVGVHDVEWVGDIVQAVDGKNFYHSCCVNGVTYNVHDYALFRSSLDKLVPSKLQAMWEDNKTGLKWLVVKRCYFPGELPEAVGRPYTSESSEIYESKHDSTLMAGLIQGPCEVLTPAKYEERRSLLRTDATNRLRPIFLCRWLYDEFKGIFKPAIS